MAQQAEKKEQEEAPAPVADVQENSSSSSSSPASKPAAPKKSKGKKSALPTWITSNLKNKRSLQLWFRSWLVSWAAFVLMLPTRSLTNLGQAAFFTCIVTLMLPPLMTPFLWIFAMATLIIGALLGWALGCAAMASALRARNFLVTGMAVQKAQQSAASATNPEAAFRSTIFVGDYLDTKSSVVFGAYLLFFTYILGFITARAQKLKLFSIFATIVLDVHITYGPLFPTPNYTLATIFMLPIAYSLAIAAFCIFFVFPRTLNADWTDEMAGVLRQTSDLLAIHRAYLHKAVTGRDIDDDSNDADAQKADDAAQGGTHSFPDLSAEFEPKFRAVTSGIIQGIESLSGSAPFLELEPSRGLFSGKDLRKVLNHVKSGGTRIFGINAFHHLIENEEPEDDQPPQPSPADNKAVDAQAEEDDEAENEVTHATFHIHASLRLMHWKKHRRGAEAAQHVRFREDLLPILHRGAMPALTAAQSALDSLSDWLTASNQGRWTLTAKQRQAARQTQVDKLQNFRDRTDAFEVALDHFINNERTALLQPYAGHFLTQDGSGNERYLSKDTYKAFRHSARPVFLCLLFCANLSNFGHTYIEHSRSIIALSERRVFGLSETQQKDLTAEHGGKLEYAKLSHAGPKIWMPTGLRKLGKIILSRRSGAAGVGPGSSTAFPSEIEDDGRDEEVTAVRRREQPDTESDAARTHNANYHLHAAHTDAQHQAELEELAETDDEEDDTDRDTLASSTMDARSVRLDSCEPRKDGDALNGTNGAAAADVEKATAAPSKHNKGKRRHKRVYAPDPDALPPSNALQRFSRLVSNAYDTACSTDGIFALRYALVSFAVWIPAVIPSSAGFYYQNRGLWALIMAQTGLTTTTGEAVFQIVGRLSGTAVGALLGMVAWYISAGSGYGNAIALAAVMAVVFVPLTFFRAFVPLPLLIPTMLTSVTLVLVVGYSWIDTHLPGLTANSGWGKDVAWRRLLLVLIGVAAAIIIMLFPRPISTREQTRKGLASVTRDIHRLYCLLIEAWIISDVPSPSDTGLSEEESLKRVQERIEAKLVLFRTRFQMAQAKLAGLGGKIKLAGIDLQLRGRFDVKSYEALLRTQARQLEALAQLAGSLHYMRPEWRHQFAMNTAVLNPDIVSDISLQLSLIATALDKAEPLPHAGVGVLLERVLLAGVFSGRIREALDAQAKGDEAPKDFFAQALSFETLEKPDYMNVVLGAMALTSLARRTDELSNIVATLCGEIQIRGFDRLRDDQGRRQLKAFGIEGI
ncbi:hypothetical protein OC842_004149 [Tilletia horrida]|uniref:ER transporter 6TM N-terminal domain-containing protein n=1 Tax=Tilletia horrida TaxID=155126 RepID=A0AAN6JK61_9BASI|nr:hypothetical protein OC842_004149 [Tilletia horrida]